MHGALTTIVSAVVLVLFCLGLVRLLSRLDRREAACADEARDRIRLRYRDAFPDPGTRARLLDRERSRFPGEDETRLMDRVLRGPGGRVAEPDRGP